MRRVVVFDTGMGGRIFAKNFREKLEDVRVIEVIDEKNAPYGEKSDQEIVELSERALRRYLGGEDIIVIACNTATTHAIGALRRKYPTQTFVGTEPGIRPAVRLTKTKSIVVLATPATLSSRRYQNLLNTENIQDIKICAANCKSWAKKIDEKKLTKRDVQRALILFRDEHPDVVVLACTHYLAIDDEWIHEVLPGAVIYSPLKAITARVKEVIRQQK